MADIIMYILWVILISLVTTLLLLMIQCARINGEIVKHMDATIRKQEEDEKNV